MQIGEKLLLISEKIWFTPFWELTRWGFLRYYFGKINEGSDEFGNLSRFIIIPLVGEFVWFTGEICQEEDCEHNEEAPTP